MELSQTLDFFYGKCSKRIKKAVTESGLSLSKIYKSDPKILSTIQNENRTKRNPYLVPDRVFYDAANNDGLLIKLDFETRQDILWGTEAEIKAYAKELFFIIFSDLQEHQSELDFSIEELLWDYVPYAKNTTLLHLCEDNFLPAIYYGISEDSIYENIFDAREQAFIYLYKKCESDYLSALIAFTQETISFKMIDKVLYNGFFCAKLNPILKNQIPDENSLGIRVKNLITADLSHTPKLMMRAEEDGLEAYYKALNHASSEYILALEKIQAELYREYEI